MGSLNAGNIKLNSLNPRSLESCRAKNATPEQISSYYSNDNLNKILEKYDLQDKPVHIFNLDETGLQPYHKPSNIIAVPNSKPQAIVSSKYTTVTSNNWMCQCHWQQSPSILCIEKENMESRADEGSKPGN